MSQAEMDRFAAAVLDNAALAESYKDLTDAAAVAARLRADGFEVTDAEVEDAARSGQTLSEEQLDGVAGGAIGLVFGALTLIGAVGTFGALAVVGIVNRAKGVPMVAKIGEGP